MRATDLVTAAVSALLHLAVLVWITPRDQAGPPPARGHERAPLEVVTLDRATLEEILEPAPPVPTLDGLRELDRAGSRSEAPAWPQAEIREPALREMESAVVGVPRLEPGLPLEGPIERLHRFRPLVIRPATPAPRPSEDGRTAPDGTSAETGATPRSDDGESEPSQALPNLDDVTRLLTRRSVPEYPERARRLGLEGVVSVGIEIGNDGRVIETWVLKSSGHRILDRRATKGLEAWRFDMRAVERAGLGRRFRQDVGFSLR